jgi:hypothetical protein
MQVTHKFINLLVAFFGIINKHKAVRLIVFNSPLSRFALRGAGYKRKGCTENKYYKEADPCHRGIEIAVNHPRKSENYYNNQRRNRV